MSKQMTVVNGPKAKKAKKRKGGRKRREQKDGKMTSIKTSSVPASFGSTIRNVGQFITSSSASHPEWGPGSRVTGTCVTCTIVNPDAADIITFGDGPFRGFVTDALDSNTTENIILNPNFIDASGRLSEQASLYSRFVIRKIKFSFIPMCPTSSQAGWVLGLSTDPTTISEFTPSFITVSSLKPSVSMPFWKEGDLDFKYNGSTCYFTEVPDLDVTDPRLYAQGTLIGFIFGSPPATSLSAGVLVADYIIDFYSPVPSTTDAGLLALIRAVKSDYRKHHPIKPRRVGCGPVLKVSESKDTDGDPPVLV